MKLLPILPPSLLLLAICAFAICACTNPLDIDTPRDRITDTSDTTDTTDTLPAPRISVALAFDASGSMMGAGNAAAKSGALLLIDSLDGVIDQACVLWFTSTVTWRKRMTTRKDSLRAAVQALPAAGATAVWDAAWAAVQEVIQRAVNPSRRVIVFSDGEDNASMLESWEVVALARQDSIPVSVVFHSAVGDLPPQGLFDLADSTGGSMHRIWTAAGADSAYTQILKTMRRKR